MRYIQELKEDDRVVEHYFCKQKQNLKSRSGKAYLSLKLQDKTGIIDAKVWDLNKDIKSFEEGDYIKIDGIVLSYQNDLQIRVNKLRPCLDGEYDPVEYVATTDKDVNLLLTKLEDYIRSIKNVYIRQLLENIFLKNENINKSFKTHSAAKTLHHSYIGGLLEHTISIVEICDFLSNRYKNVNRDLLIAIAFLHDVGKIYELSDFPINDYTDDGQLLGHILIGAELITKEASKIEDFPDKLCSLIKHGVIAHHGEFEYGSPRRPKIIEAFLVHYVDTLDSKMNMIENFIISNNTKGSWIGYSKIFNRNMRDSNFEE